MVLIQNARKTGSLWQRLKGACSVWAMVANLFSWQQPDQIYLIWANENEIKQIAEKLAGRL